MTHRVTPLLTRRDALRQDVPRTGIAGNGQAEPGPVPILLVMGELHVARWRKYGKDRLYVNDSAGTRVGWVDLLTGARTLEVAAHATGFEAAVAGFLAAAPGGPAAARPQPAVAPPDGLGPISVVDDEMAGGVQATAEPAWVDLAVNVPGQAAREQADAELVAMRDRSRVGAFLARTFDLKTDERAWRVGADGEETVGARLEKLRKHGWHVLHAVPVGDRGSDIDHLLVGPGGVWTINTKTHPGGRVWVGRTAVRVNGHAVPYLRNSRFEATRAERLLTAAVGFPVAVRPALVFLTGTLIPNVTIKQAPDGVAVLDRMDIPRAFRRASPKLTPEHVAAVYEHARRSTTWKP